MQGCHLIGPYGETTGGGMAAVTLEQMAAGMQGLINGKTLGCPHRSAHLAIAFTGKDCHRQAPALHKPRGHNANHTMVPMVLRQ